MAHKVVAAAVVTADGTRPRCHADAHPDLLWALRGGAEATPWSPTWSWGWTGYRNCSAASRMAGERGWRACRPSCPPLAGAASGRQPPRTAAMRGCEELG
jgi:hypothetical protein